MKEFDFVASVHAEQPSGEMAFEEKDGKATNVPILLHHKDFLLGRTLDRAFIDGITSPMDAQELIYETRRSIRLQAEKAESNGVWTFEDEQAKRLEASTKKGEYNQNFAFNAVPFMRAIAGMRPVKDP